MTAEPAQEVTANGSTETKATNGKLVEATPQEHEEEEDDDDEGGDDVAGANGADKKKKKKKPKKKKKASTSTQTEPPTIPVSKFFKPSAYPVGEIQNYVNDHSYRTTSEEMREKERILCQEDPDSAFNYNAVRRAAEVHRQVRSYARKNIKPGMSMTSIAEMIENGTRALVEENGLRSGIGFPTGLSRNHCAAHYTPNAGDSIVLKAEDVLKVDFGVHVNGRIVDSAFTMTWEPTYDNLLLAVKEATNAGIKEAGIDVRMGDIGTAIQEVMESYEVEVGGKTLPGPSDVLRPMLLSPKYLNLQTYSTPTVKSIRNLTGHSIKPYHIHGGKSVPIVRQPEDKEEYNTKMEEGEYFAIETFGSTGHGWVRDDGACSHYAKNLDADRVPITMTSSKKLMATINKQFGSLPFCRRYLDRIGETSYLYALKDLVEKDLVTAYPPLSDVEGCMTAQYEHTILLRPTCKEVVSRGDDY
ncbi:BQ5605_C001g00476 [Microbotryum silenes-dioicae]|uniref:Methionine aminopeptidase 2 n=1 Tax=Microbotryum silenes-dioicae TaxID=796604 RepID=A0A2X0P674_9BASI|nr:BQ5605_C001g00476 [Microbotryum silenes-dioicae]